MNRTGWLEGMQAMDMKMPKALLWQRLRKSQKILPNPPCDRSTPR